MAEFRHMNTDQTTWWRAGIMAASLFCRDGGRWCVPTKHP